MITRTARIDSETDIASLARAVFRVARGRGGENLMARAERALLAANPSLRNEHALVPGRRILVPQVEGLALTKRVTDDGESFGELAFEALARLNKIAMSFEERAEAAKRQRERLIDLASKEEVRTIFENDLGNETAALTQALAATRREQQSEAVRLKTLRAALDTARDAFEKIAQKDVGVPHTNFGEGPSQ